MSVIGNIRSAREAASVLDLSITAAHVLLVLATYADAEGEAYPGVERLCADCRRSRSVVLAALAELELAGLMETRRRRRGPAVRRLKVSDLSDLNRRGEGSRTPDLKSAKRSDEPDASGPASRTQEVRRAGPRRNKSQKKSQKEEPAQAARASLDDRLVEEVLSSLTVCATRRRLPAPDRQRVVHTLVEHPAVDVERVARELDRGWRGEMADVVGAYAARLAASGTAGAIGSSLLADAPAELTAAWPDALAAVRRAIGDDDQVAVWRLDELELVGLDGDVLVLEAPYGHASGIRGRFDRVIAGALGRRPVRIIDAQRTAA